MCITYKTNKCEKNHWQDFLYPFYQKILILAYPVELERTTY